MHKYHHCLGLANVSEAETAKQIRGVRSEWLIIWTGKMNTQMSRVHDWQAPNGHAWRSTLTVI